MSSAKKEENTPPINSTADVSVFPEQVEKPLVFPV